jgi:molybdenum cofactor biosynthesis enzyme MoaA
MDYQLSQSGQTAHVEVTRLPTGDPLPALIELEKELADQNLRRIELFFSEGASPPVDRLTHAGYQESGSERFFKSVHYQPSVRFSITEKCNYACFFCHEEGMEMGKARAAAQQEQLFDVLRQFHELNYQDFTFTGGEPLLNPNKIVACLDYMESIGYLPDITFVSNGLALTEKLLARLQAYPGKMRFNISMHSLEEHAYNQIVQDIQKPNAPLCHNEHRRVKENLLKLQAAGIPFKLNFVLLKGLNTSDEAIQAVLDYALQLGATRIKFLELLLTKELNHLYGYFYRLDALRERLSDHLTLTERSFRRDVYRYADTQLELEFQHCTCARGCNTCTVNRDANFTAELKYFPCFLHSDEDFDLKTVALEQAIAQGDQKIQRMAQYYGDDSPIIVRNHYLTQEEQFYYYLASSSAIEQLKRKLSLEERLERRRDFNEIYLTLVGQAGDDFSTVYKLSRNSYDQHALEIEQAYSFDPLKPGLVTTHFSGESQKVIDPDLYLKQLAEQGYEQRLNLNWSIFFYRLQRSSSVRQSELSISHNPESGLFFVRSDTPLDDEQLKPMTEPLASYISTRMRLA